MISCSRLSAVLAAIGLAVSCGGSNSVRNYSEREVRAAFATGGIPLGVRIRLLQPDNPLKVILGPNPVRNGCDDSDLSVNIFESNEALTQYLERATGVPVKDRYLSKETIGLVKGNVGVSLRRKSSCFREPDVAAALHHLP